MVVCGSGVVKCCWMLYDVGAKNRSALCTEVIFGTFVRGINAEKQKKQKLPNEKINKKKFYEKERHRKTNIASDKGV